MFDEKNRYIIEDYQTKPPFTGFLPGIAGTMGIPIWCFYNNRGQAVCSFGAVDKDHAVMEFSPAYCAYRDVSRRGFRTFCRVNGEYRELFSRRCDMHIGAAEVEIVCKSGEIEASALYFGLPNEQTAALVRVLTVKNVSDKPLSLEILDAMPELVPYGTDQKTLKNMTQLATAWMQSEDAGGGLACFRLRASMADTAQVTEIKGCNFCLSIDESGSRLDLIAEQQLIFGSDTSFAFPAAFMETELRTLLGQKRTAENSFTCCFSPKTAVAAPQGEIKIYSLYGQTENIEKARALSEKITGAEWFEKKRREASELVEGLTYAAYTKTSDPIFDGYCRQTYLDNLLRGGTPYFFESGRKKAPFYLYSRKHGDPERDYNYFSLGGEYFAQGNGNFRDVSQNRRCDVLFNPEIDDTCIHTFYELIQPDGYNPLVLTAETYTLPSEAFNGIFQNIPIDNKELPKKFLSKPFTPGALAMAAEEWGLSREGAATLTAVTVCASYSEPNAEFSEGYWCDHWTYNLDLIESYLAVYPERERELIFDTCDYKWYAPYTSVNPREQRYCMTENGLRQYNALTEIKPPKSKWVTVSGGEPAKSPLIEKLLLLCAVKTATLDAAGMGIEMEGGKPGWYDALNGLPGLLGSSAAETCELLRLIRFTSDALKKRVGAVKLYVEIAELIADISQIIEETEDTYIRWNRSNDVKEKYRAATAGGFNGGRISLDSKSLTAALKTMETAAETGIKRAAEYGNGVIPTYFTFDAENVRKTERGYMPQKLIPKPLPLFLEGAVHQLKLSLSEEERLAVANGVKNSGLYDKELKMYKVNESLKNVSFEAGRTKAFTPGWLENESIWLHMEYKYLLELLKGGLYGEFSEAFHDAAVPFLDPLRYGRSPLENVSFLVSSANSDVSKRGRGYVARLSGSTAEFLEIWQTMFFGRKPFLNTENGLNLKFTPFIPDYLIPRDGEIQTVFLGKISITYRIVSEHYGNECFEVQSWLLTFCDGSRRTVEGSFLSDKEARAVREGTVKNMNIILKRGL
ncbi:MAG: hypothetical protein NC394_09405 [Bacteroides sp.]|nr:hypothetical protein [Bacteroides sp.]